LPEKNWRDFDRGGLGVRPSRAPSSPPIDLAWTLRIVPSAAFDGSGRAHHVAIFQNGRPSPSSTCTTTDRGHEIDQFAEERTRLVNGVEGFRLCRGSANALLGHDTRAPPSRSGVTAPVRLRSVASGFDDRESAFNRHCLRPCKTLVGEVRGLISAPPHDGKPTV